MQNFSLLDLAPVTEDETPAQALAHAADLARHAEALGYHRYWLAEHHNMPGIASAATAVVIGHVAQATSTIRVGAGGIMLPNHAPLVVAEQFGTLDALHPGRIDLGLGRAPGTDGATAQALRRYHQSADAFPQDVVELMGYLDDDEGRGPVRAVPGMGSHLPVWILGSSTFGAQLAAYLGLPYAFASHFAPQMLEPAIEAYREGFRPSERLDKPHFMMAAGLHAADTDEEARYHRSSQILSFARLRTGTPGRLSRPVENVADHVPASAIAGAEAALSVSATGSPDTVRRQLREMIDRYQPDELMLTGMMFEPGARKRSFEIGAQILSDMKTPTMT
ncbi:LLM class flavin-dependent oxidoreductase [Limimaricola cinnabarinus]|uniref:Luciferase-like monooxygenase n=1 Tax=Limimaricola cinnabarinus LL-001 TaxID=1337093 RepID=U2YJR8_9RHOB|nr:LLM class flavin-dependent oxidoreductase [Limimaricola cinnabarinus]GAD55136.1 bacterial luciferase family protein [Limimaricola cinnabarinus LL-001]